MPYDVEINTEINTDQESIFAGINVTVYSVSKRQNGMFSAVQCSSKIKLIIAEVVEFY